MATGLRPTDEYEFLEASAVQLEVYLLYKYNSECESSPYADAEAASLHMSSHAIYAMRMYAARRVHYPVVDVAVQRRYDKDMVMSFHA